MRKKGRNPQQQLIANNKQNMWVNGNQLAKYLSIKRSRLNRKTCTCMFSVLGRSVAILRQLLTTSKKNIYGNPLPANNMQCYEVTEAYVHKTHIGADRGKCLQRKGDSGVNYICIHMHHKTPHQKQRSSEEKQYSRFRQNCDK